MKKQILLLLTLLFAVGCGQSSKESVHYVESIRATYPGDSLSDEFSYTIRFEYNDDRQIARMTRKDDSGRPSGLVFTYSGNEVVCTPEGGEDELKISYRIGENGLAEYGKEEHRFGNITMTGINRFEYANGKLVGIKSMATMQDDAAGEEPEPTMPLDVKVKWEGRNLKRMVSGVVKQQLAGEPLQVSIDKTYDMEADNNTNLDLNFMLEQYILNRTFLIHYPLIFGCCGDKSGQLISTYHHTILLSDAPERVEDLTFRFRHFRDRKGRLKKIRVLQEDGTLITELSLKYVPHF